MRIDEIAQRIVWHASYTPGIKKFRFLTHLGTWAAAAERALGKEFYPSPGELFYLPVYMYQVDTSGCRKGVKIYDDSYSSKPMDHVINNWEFMPREVRKKFHDTVSDSALAKQLPSAFAELGIDYLWYYNRVESPGSKSFVVLNPDCFKITGVQKTTPADIIRGDPSIVANMVRRGQWPAEYKATIAKLLKAQKNKSTYPL